jgi:hypothetical protein
MSNIAPRRLSQIASSAGFNASDLAFLAGLNESTVCRLWDDPCWLDRIQGRSLQAMISVLPGVAEYAFDHPLRVRRERLLDEMDQHGIPVNRPAVKHLIALGAIPEQYVANTLEAATQIMSMDEQRAAAYLTRFWGRDQDYVLDALFDRESGNGLLRDAGPLIAASAELAVRLAKRTNSVHASIAHATLIHHMARTTGNLMANSLKKQDRQSAFTYRSGMVGMIINTDDQDIADRYIHAVRNDALLALIEDWAFPTYTRDIRLNVDFSVPRSLLLQRTASEVIREIDSHNDAYLHYLCTTYIPLALGRDGSFGCQLPELRRRLAHRSEQCKEVRTEVACRELVRRIDRTR